MSYLSRSGRSQSDSGSLASERSRRGDADSLATTATSATTASATSAASPTAAPHDQHHLLNGAARSLSYKHAYVYAHERVYYTRTTRSHNLYTYTHARAYTRTCNLYTYANMHMCLIYVHTAYIRPIYVHTQAPVSCTRRQTHMSLVSADLQEFK